MNDYLRGVSLALKRIVFKNEILLLDESDEICLIGQKGVPWEETQIICGENDLSILNRNIDILSSKLGNCKVLIDLSHYGSKCGVLRANSNESLKNLTNLVNFDKDDVFVYDIDGINGLHLELLDGSYYGDDLSGSDFIYGLRIWGDKWQENA